MVIGLFIVTAIPTVTGVAQAFSAQKTHEQQEEDERRMRKFNIDITSDTSGTAGREIQNGRVVVRDGRVWVGPPAVDREGEYGYVSECMMVEYPDTTRDPVALGLASQVQDNPPLLNWIYIDKDTMELKYGNKTASIAHHVGPWDWIDEERYLTIKEPQGGQEEDFVAVKKSGSNDWQLFYDMDGDWLAEYLPPECEKVQIRLRRTLVARK